MLKLTVITVLLVATTGCWGNLSNDDLFFLAGVPKAKEVELTVQGDEGNPTALTHDAIGEVAGIYSDAQKSATKINGDVGDLLTMIENLGKDYPPTERTEDARIWGPIENLDGRTLKVEIRREELEGGQPRFRYCIQVARDEDVSGKPNRCGEPDASGFRTVVGGFFDPMGEDGGARSGSGQLEIDLDTIQGLGMAQDQEAQGRLTLTYDFSRGGDVKSIAVDIVIGTSANTAPTTLAYLYSRGLDGHVDYRFALENVPPQSSTAGQNPGSWQIDAVWDEGGPGRGDGRGEGGDLQADQYVTVTQCWDTDHKITYETFAVWQTGSSTPILSWALPLGGDPAALCP